ncbi:uncharacterized protein DEA37_0003942, partial [Paragonimus westermani]
TPNDENGSGTSHTADRCHLTSLTDSQRLRRKNSISLRADSPVVGSDLTRSRTADLEMNKRNTNHNTVDGGSNTNSSLAGSRKRARGETQRVSSFSVKQQSAHAGLLSTNDIEGSSERQLTMDDVDDDPDDANSIEDEHRALDRRDVSELDYPLDDLHPSADLDMSFRGRQRRQTYQLPPRRRDSSLTGYGNQGLYGSNGGGTLPRRRRTDISLTRATTISGVDPLGTLRSANRIAQSIRNGSIPPPPSEPPPATPLSGSIMSELGSVSAGLVNPFLLQMHNQQQPQQQQSFNAALLAAVASGRVNPQLLASVNNPSGLQSAYMLNPNSDASQLLQLQQQHQASMLQQQQQQQQQQLLAAGLMHPALSPSSLQTSHYGFHTSTLGRRTDPSSVASPPFPSLISAAALLSAQQQQQQQQSIYQQHPICMAPMNDLTKLTAFLTSPSTALPQSDQNEMNKSTIGPGGSGSVVYENSYNSFHRLLSSTVPPSVSQDGLQSMMNHALSVGGDGLTMSLTAASVNNSNMPIRSQTLGHEDMPSVALLQTTNSMPPLPPPNHPSYDLLDARSVDPTYGTRETIGSYGNQKPHTEASLVVQTRKSKRRCPWYYWIISILVLAFLLALVLAISFSGGSQIILTFFLVSEKQHLGVRLIERFNQDPAIIGLFDPDNPAVKLEPNKPVHIQLDRMGAWSAEWQMRTARHVRYNITITSELTSIGVFMRRSTMPTIVEYDIFDRITGRMLQVNNVRSKSSRRTKRASEPRSLYKSSVPMAGGFRETSRVHYLEEGVWFLALVNNKPRPEPITFSMGDAIMDDGCPNDCSNRGVCNRGNCDCVNGFKGPDCSVVFILLSPFIPHVAVAEVPRVCNGHGDYLAGACQCYPEWKGRECEILWSECTDPTCSGHGQCVTGECQCYRGYAGESCETRTCVSSNCSGHGVCQDGECRCFSGWSGPGCDLSVPVMHTASFTGGTGRTRNESSNPASFRPSASPLRLLDARAHQDCPLNCGHWGTCTLDLVDRPRCECAPGWHGDRCDRQTCSSQCFKHGQCANGTCLCQAGFTGTQCTLGVCLKHCNSGTGHGNCVLDSSTDTYRCECASGWKGSICQVKAETVCNDGTDDDQDGLTDCLDPDCCSSQYCRDLVHTKDPDAKESCAHSDSFHYRLLITPVAQPGSTFYGQLEFLLRRDGVPVDNFDPRRISVIRGTVRQWDGTTFWGVRVSDSRKIHNGYTLTDEQGRFDLPVDGGAMVKLEFLRHPTTRFAATHHVYVPVNEILNLGDFYMYDAQLPRLTSWPATPQISSIRGTDGGGILAPSPIMHDLWVSGQFVTQTGDGAKCTETESGPHRLTALDGLVVEVERIDGDVPVCVDRDKLLCVNNGNLFYSILLGDSRIRLLYRSDRTAGYQSLVRVHLLSRQRAVPERLREIHLILDVAGLRQTRRLEPEPGLIQTFMWNKTDGYNRTVYGLVNAKVSAGYVYEGCAQVVWEHRIVQLAGHELSSSELANWNLDLVHFYAVNHGIVYRGDGLHLFLKHIDWHVIPILGQLGEGRRRAIDTCPQCESGQGSYGTSVLQLVSLISDTVGNLLVADGAYLRWLQPLDESIKTRQATYTASSESLDTRAQTAFRSSDRRIWLARNASKLNFLRPNLDELVARTSGHTAPQYYLAPHPNFLLGQSIFDLPVNSYGIQAGLFLSHAESRTIWWFADSTHPQPLVSVDCTEQDIYPAMIGVHCAKHSLQSPQGLAATQTELFFADGGIIWRMSLKSTTDPKRAAIRQAIGQASKSFQLTLLCEQSVPADQVTLRSPTSLVYSALEDVIYIADENLVYRLHLATQLVSIVAGRLDGCPSEPVNDSGSPPIATEIPLSEIRGLAITPEGDLYIAESDGIWIRRADGRLHPVAGKTTVSSIPIDEPLTSSSSQPFADVDQTGVVDLGLAQDFRFSNISAITASIYGELFVADTGHGLVSFTSISNR